MDVHISLMKDDGCLVQDSFYKTTDSKIVNQKLILEVFAIIIKFWMLIMNDVCEQ